MALLLVKSTSEEVHYYRHLHQCLYLIVVYFLFGPLSFSNFSYFTFALARYHINILPFCFPRFTNLHKVLFKEAILKFVKRVNHPIVIVYCKDNKMKWWKSSEGFPYFLEFEKDKPPTFGSVANELFTTKKVYTGDESKQQIWKSDWLRMRNNDEPDSPFFEYCLFVKSFNYSISVIWEK